MTTYIALVYETETPRDPSAPDFMSYMQPWIEFGERAGSAVVGGAILLGNDAATTIEVLGGRGGEVVLHDGPYAETKEILGGFYLLEAPDLDAAIALAADLPSAWNGGRVEVRPTMTM